MKGHSDLSGYFLDDPAFTRSVGALMVDTDDEWAAARCLVGLEYLAEVTDGATVGLPGAAA